MIYPLVIDKINNEYLYNRKLGIYDISTVLLLVWFWLRRKESLIHESILRNFAYADLLVGGWVRENNRKGVILWLMVLILKLVKTIFSVK